MAQKWVLTAALLIVFLAYLTPPLDTDLGWHLRYGQHLFETHRVYRANEIGFFLPDYQWAHSYSLYQLLTFFLFKTSGFWGLMILGSGVLTASYLLILQSQREKFLWFLIGLPFVFLLSQPITSLGFRSQLFSILGVSLLFFLFLNLKKFNFWHCLILLVSFILWANLHGGFILGFLLLIFAAIDQLWQRRFREVFWILSTVILGIFAVGFTNPFGFRLFAEVYRHAWYPLNQLIAEWVPPDPIYTLLIFLVVIAVGVQLLSLIAQQEQLSQNEKIIFLTLAWLLFTLLALQARRNLPFFALGSLLLLVKTLPAKEIPKKVATLSNFIPLFILFALTIWRLTTLPDLSDKASSICKISRYPLPCQAVSYLKSQPNLCRNIFNTYEWGGYLAWHLPQIKTFVDGRMPAWETKEQKSPYTIYLKIIQAQPGFEERLNSYGADCLLISQGTFLDLALRKATVSNYQLLFSDKTASLYRRNSKNTSKLKVP